MTLTLMKELIRYVNHILVCVGIYISGKWKNDEIWTFMNFNNEKHGDEISLK